jgi:RNA polymerase sigma factor (TIGR02999 family)
MISTQSLASVTESGEAGYPTGGEALFSTLYGELHRLARREARRSGNADIGATTLLHEAYLNIARRDDILFPDRSRFMAYATRAMRGLVIDHVRSRHAHKRGGLFELTTLRTTVVDSVSGEHDLQELSDALDGLAQVEPALAEVVDLKFFCGFTFAEIAAMRNISERTVQRQWEKARVYLHRALTDPQSQTIELAAIPA